VRLVSPIGSASGGSGNQGCGTSKIFVGFQRQLRWDNHL
jgi:hypothetical protein